MAAVAVQPFLQQDQRQQQRMTGGVGYTSVVTVNGLVPSLQQLQRQQQQQRAAVAEMSARVATGWGPAAPYMQVGTGDGGTGARLGVTRVSGACGGGGSARRYELYGSTAVRAGCG